MIEMLSSVVNSLTYRVLSHLFFYIFVTFFSNLYILVWQKTMKFVDLFGEIWLNCIGTFCIPFWSTFWKKLTVYAVFGSQISKKCIFWDFLAWFCTVLLWNFFTYFFELCITCFVHFFLQKSCVFMFFGKK